MEVSRCTDDLDLNCIALLEYGYVSVLNCIRRYDVYCIAVVESDYIIIGSFALYPIDTPCNPPDRGRPFRYVSHLQRRTKNAMWSTKFRPLDPIDIHASTFVKLMVELFLLTLFFRYNSRMNGHVGVGSCSSTL